jgi:hypothetical protein
MASLSKLRNWDSFPVGAPVVLLSLFLSSVLKVRSILSSCWIRTLSCVSSDRKICSDVRIPDDDEMRCDSCLQDEYGKEDDVDVDVDEAIANEFKSTWILRSDDESKFLCLLLW